MSSAVRDELLKTVRRETSAQRLLPSLITSSVVAMMTVVMSVSFVAIIFVDPISGFVGEGTSLMLLMAGILGIFMAVFSSYPTTIAIPQDRVAPIVALMASIIIHRMAGSPPLAIGLTVLASIATSTLLVGVVLFLLGTYRLGNIVRFTPYPVIGGFLAGSGWLLLTGSFRVISGETFAFQNIRHFIAEGSLVAWIPCALFGTVAYLGVRFSRHYMTLPVMVFASALGFYGWLGFNHHALEVARQHGWILSVPSGAGVTHILTFPSLMRADWNVVFDQYPSFVALLLTSIVSILLNTSALELEADEDIDLNRELRAAGMANVVGGFAGGMIGFQSLSLSSLAVGMRVKSRLVGLISAGVCLLLLVFGTQALGYIPKFVLGGILFYAGLSFLTEWVFDAYFRLIREDYFLVVLILAIVAFVDYLRGVGAGIIVATVLFVLKYSTVNVISSTLSGDSHHSTVDRSPLEARHLNDRGGQILIMRLKGYIFFGSADNLLNSIRERQADSSLPRLGYVILDFQQVSGLDTSGLVSIQKLARLARKARFTILAASVPADIQNSFRNAKLIGEEPGQIRLFRDRDFSIEWCENEILQREVAETTKETRNLPQILNDFHPWETDTGILFNYLERQEVGKNHYLMLQGDPSDDLFFIEAGRVRVVVELDNGRLMRVRTMEAGTVVGEIGLYLGQPRVASVVTEEPCVILRLSAESLQRMQRENPALASAFHEFMVRVLAERVTQQNRTLRALVE
ncbi:MAG TPA: SulP family inorganic anion transporter [Candidatus Methylacidiphilales bacterium]|jgi:SulP family sulfate permease|nr:SulP family inorganic anion transporter [Candidatus Methylacidiphilales bacterium]